MCSFTCQSLSSCSKWLRFPPPTSPTSFTLILLPHIFTFFSPLPFLSTLPYHFTLVWKKIEFFSLVASAGCPCNTPPFFLFSLRILISLLIPPQYYSLLLSFHPYFHFFIKLAIFSSNFSPFYLHLWTAPLFLFLFLSFYALGIYFPSLKLHLCLPPYITPLIPSPSAFLHKTPPPFFPHLPPLPPFIRLFWGLNLIISCSRETTHTHTWWEQPVGSSAAMRDGRAAFVLPSAGRLWSCQQGTNTHIRCKRKPEMRKENEKYCVLYTQALTDWQNGSDISLLKC